MNSMLNTENIAKNTNNMEFGSDFHLCAYPIGKSILDIYQNANLYIDGRQALIDIVKQNQWERIWVPSYYCYEFVESIRPYIEVKYYNYTPFEDLNQALDKITISDKEAIVISNFFGLNDQSHNYLKGTVIEDHSHDLISDWARNSNADWCFASLRKTLPVADGGILWSPKHYNLPRQPRHTEAGDKLADDRYRAMALKSQYLEGTKIDKDVFREIYIRTENEFDMLPISCISKQSFDIISQLDIEKWYNTKRNNWELAATNIVTTSYIKVLTADTNVHNNHPFSIILMLGSQVLRDKFRTLLIQNKIYPAILWSIPSDKCSLSQDFSNTMLSIHCDARYNSEEMMIMINRINNIIKCLE